MWRLCILTASIEQRLVSIHYWKSTQSLVRLLSHHINSHPSFYFILQVLILLFWQSVWAQASFHPLKWPYTCLFSYSGTQSEHTPHSINWIDLTSVYSPILELGLSSMSLDLASVNSLTLAFGLSTRTIPTSDLILQALILLFWHSVWVQVCFYHLNWPYKCLFSYSGTQSEHKPYSIIWIDITSVYSLILASAWAQLDLILQVLMLLFWNSIWHKNHSIYDLILQVLTLLFWHSV